MKIRSDYSVQSSNLPVKRELAYNKANRDTLSHRGMIIDVLYTDDPRNPTRNSQNPQMVYDVIIIGGPREGQIVKNCRSMNLLGGKSNYAEIVYRKASKPFVGAGSLRLNKQDGDIVYVEFIDGDQSAGVITGMGNHPLDSTNTGATKAQGPRMVWEYNGIFQEVNKNGELTLRRKGGSYKSPEDYFEPVADGDEATFQLKEKQVVLSVNKGSITQTIDGKNDKVTVTTKSGLSVTIDGASKKASVKVSSTEIEIDGNTGKISLKGDLVDLGAAVSDLAVLFTELASAFDNHTHMFTDITPSGPVPSVTQPPLAPLLSSVASQTVKVQP